jgi:hypothetical protein
MLSNNTLRYKKSGNQSIGMGGATNAVKIMNYSKFNSGPVAGLCTAILLGLAVATPSALAGNTIYLAVGPTYGGVNPYQYGDGGEFTAFLYSGVPAGYVPTGYSSQATFKLPGGSIWYSAPGGDGGGSIGDKPFVGLTGFETFCVEDQVDFYVGYAYSYTEGFAVQQAKNGYLTAGVAWLYEHFARGDLKGYDYTNASTRLTDAGELQAALWYLEGEPADSSVQSNPSASNNQFLKLVGEYFGHGSTAADIANGLKYAADDAIKSAGKDDPYDVEVLELCNGSSIAQDQLIYNGPSYTPPPPKVPDSSSTLGLLGATFIALVLFKRKYLAV